MDCMILTILYFIATDPLSFWFLEPFFFSCRPSVMILCYISERKLHNWGERWRAGLYVWRREARLHGDAWSGPGQGWGDSAARLAGGMDCGTPPTPAQVATGQWLPDQGTSTAAQQLLRLLQVDLQDPHGDREHMDALTWYVWELIAAEKVPLFDALCT